MNWIYFSIGILILISSLTFITESDEARSEQEKTWRAIHYAGNAVVGVGFVLAGYILYLMSKG